MRRYCHTLVISAHLGKEVGFLVQKIGYGTLDGWIGLHKSGILGNSLHLFDESSIGVLWWGQLLHANINARKTCEKKRIHLAMANQLYQCQLLERL